MCCLPFPARPNLPNRLRAVLARDRLPILYQDAHYVAVNKPSGLLVHRSAIDRQGQRFAMQMTRDQIGQRIYPVHRLDKPTSGVLIFALSPEAARRIGPAFAGGEVAKTYLAVVRGSHTAGDGDQVEEVHPACG